jgi:insulysin
MQTAREDANQVKLLTKQEMVDFYATYIAPESPSRAKLVVDLVAQNQKENGVEINGELASEPPSNGSTRVIIQDVRNYKSGLVASAGARPIKDISEFEDTDSKL